MHICICTILHESVQLHFELQQQKNSFRRGHLARYEVLKSFDAIVKNVANSYRLQEECDVISLRMAKIPGPASDVWLFGGDLAIQALPSHLLVAI